MKKIVKLFAVVLAVLMLGSVLVACDKGSKTEETEAQTAAPSITVEIIVKNAAGKEVHKETVANTNKTKLGDILDVFCGYIGDDAECVFDETTGMLVKLGDVAPDEKKGEFFTAYYESQGKDKAFLSIKNEVITDGQTVVIVVDKQ